VTHSFRFDIAIIAWLGFPRPFRSRWDREFESALLQRRVRDELGNRPQSGTHYLRLGGRRHRGNWDFAPRPQSRHPRRTTALAYAHYVQARAKSDDLDGLRYFYQMQMARLPTQLAKAQTAAALAQYGGMASAAAVRRRQSRQSIGAALST
jgi:hypothetical protein